MNEFMIGFIEVVNLKFLGFISGIAVIVLLFMIFYSMIIFIVRSFE